MPGGKSWRPAEDQALKDLVKERTGDELAPVGLKDAVWADLVKRWEGLGKAKGFRTDRSAEVMYHRHLKLRRKAGRTDSAPSMPFAWSEEEEKALLAFAKERKGDEMAAMGSKSAFNDLAKVWQQSKGFNTARTAAAMAQHHCVMRNQRIHQLHILASFTTSATAQDPSLRRSARKRTASNAVLATPSSSAAAKKPTSDTSYSPSPYAASCLPPAVKAAVSVKKPESDSDSDSDANSDTGSREYSRWLRANGLQ
mmetsp:Transcript_29500/g.58783  ORF Transcript_29500/g.58783 Transcript_29500/m.58783 type:complete len:254 (-) Transcript_29500:69-830(-)